MDNFECAGYYFNSNFDSGNLAKVELLTSYGDGNYVIFFYLLFLRTARRESA